MKEAPLKRLDIGHPVALGDLLPFAKANCPNCHGSAEYSIAPPRTVTGDRINRNYGGRGIPAEEFKKRQCGCAYLRFMKRYRGKVGVAENGALHWLADTPENETCYAATHPTLPVEKTNP